MLLLGRETLYEDDVPEEEVEAELAPLTSQLAYVASRLGRSEEASTSYQDLLTKHQAEENVLAVVQNNLLALQSGTQSHQKRFAGEALKKFEGLMDSERPGLLLPGVEARLSEQQKQALHTNHALLLLLTNKGEACQLKLDLMKTRSAFQQGSAICETKSYTMFMTTKPAADTGIGMSAVPFAVIPDTMFMRSGPAADTGIGMSAVPFAVIPDTMFIAAVCTSVDVPIGVHSCLHDAVEFRFWLL